MALPWPFSFEGLEPGAASGPRFKAAKRWFKTATRGFFLPRAEQKSFKTKVPELSGHSIRFKEIVVKGGAALVGRWSESRRCQLRASKEEASEPSWKELKAFGSVK